MKQDSTDYDQPVAYDREGRPLYARPQKKAETMAGQDPQVVYLTRAIDPHQQEVPPEIKQKHDESVRKFPQLNLSDGEYVISAVRRHPIGLISIWVVVIVALLLTLAIPAIFVNLHLLPQGIPAEAVSFGLLLLVIVTLILLVGGLIATIVYDANRFYLTNESVTQHIKNSLFHKNDQTISLGNIEDASYQKKGIIQTIFNYGTIRLSTQGEETTYRFSFVADPEQQIKLLNDAVEAFKNFRPIDEHIDDQ